MVLVDLYFHYGGDWITDPEVKYESRMVHKWSGYDSDHLSFIDLALQYINELGYVGVQQLIVGGPSGRLYEVSGDGGICCLLELINDRYKSIDIYVVDENELGVQVPNIIDHTESLLHDVVTAIDESETDEEYDTASDSDLSDFDLDELESLAAEKNRKLTDKLDCYKTLDKSMSFKDIPEARKHLKLYALATGYGIVPVKSDKTRVRYTCEEGCPFVCLISRDGKVGGVRVKTLKDEHTCEPVFDNPRVDSKTVAHYFKRKLQDTPKYRVKEMKEDLVREFNINVSYNKCKRAKKLILEVLEGSFNDDYKRIEAYANELRNSNPGSDIVINISKDALEEGKRKFQRMYICFNALKVGFKAGLRPFIGLDGTFLKGKAKGILLVAVAQDSMNHFYPLAWAIVDRETKLTWRWFMSLLQDSLELKDGEGFTFISDMQKGLIEAIKYVLPEAHHRFCVKHIEANWCKTWKVGVIKKYLWWCAWSTYVEDFKDQLTKLGEIEKKAAEDVLSYPVRAWVRAYFDTNCKNMAVDNNLTESFNAWVLDARHKPIIRMLEDIRVKVMDMLREHEREAATWKGNFSPKAMKLYLQYMKIANTCKAVFNGDNGFEIVEGTDTHTVNLEEKKCTCRAWDLSGIPCPHVIKALLHLKIDPLTEMHWWHSKEAFLLAYKNKLQPVRGSKFWTVEPSQAMEPPIFVNRAGRPRVKRTREKDEAINRQAGWTTGRKGRVMTCSTCGQPDHNSRGCGKETRRKKKKKGKEATSGPSDRQHSPVAADPCQEEIQLSGSMPTQESQASGAAGLRQVTQVLAEECEADFEPETEAAIRPTTISELETRLRLRMSQIPTGTRSIKFIGDGSGVSDPTDLPFTPTSLTWHGAAAITTNQLEKMAKLKTRKGNGKTQQ